MRRGTLPLSVGMREAGGLGVSTRERLSAGDTNGELMTGDFGFGDLRSVSTGGRGDSVSAVFLMPAREDVSETNVTYSMRNARAGLGVIGVGSA